MEALPITRERPTVQPIAYTEFAGGAIATGSVNNETEIDIP